MTREEALKILDQIPWNNLRYRVKESRASYYKPYASPRYDSVALSEEQMKAIAFAIMSLASDYALKPEDDVEVFALDRPREEK